jgi:hypothetical protein
MQRLWFFVVLALLGEPEAAFAKTRTRGAIRATLMKWTKALAGGQGQTPEAY